MDTAIVIHHKQLYREFLCAILQWHFAAATIKAAQQVEALLQDAATLAPDLIFMLLPHDLAQLTLIGTLHTLTPRSKIILIADHIPDIRIAEVIRQGADALLSSQSGLTELFAAIAEVEQNRRYIDPKLISVEQLRQAIEVIPVSLTPREQEVLRLLVLGLSNKMIAQEIVKPDGEHIKEQTVKTYVSNILSKLQVSSRQEAIVIALKKGMVTISEPWGDARPSE